MTNGLILILLNIAYYLCNFYPKHIFEFKNLLSIVAFFLNLIFYFIFALFLIIVFNKNKNPFSENVFSPFETICQKIQIGKIALIIISTIVFDILQYLVSYILDKNVLYFIDFSTIMLWIIFYNLCATKKYNVFLKKPFIVVIIILFIFSLTTVFNIAIIDKYNLISEKYNVFSEYLVINVKNLDFVFEIKNFILDTILGLIFIVMHSFFNKTIMFKNRVSIVQRISRTFILIVCFCVLVFLKAFIFPYSCIQGVKTLTTENSLNVETNSFYANTEITLISRVGLNRSAEIVFSKTRDEIFYNSDLILTYTSNDNKKADSYIINSNQMTIEDQFKKINYSNIEFYIYKNQVICFLDGDEPIAISFDCTSNISYNENMMLIYKALIENSNWNFFEQGTEYLLKYDKEFIDSYLERFSLGKFSEQELEMLNELSINKDYIQKIANGERQGDGSVVLTK